MMLVMFLCVLFMVLLAVLLALFLMNFLGILLVVAGIQFFTTGIIAELQMRTYFEAQQKTPYRIRRIVNTNR